MRLISFESNALTRGKNTCFTIVFLELTSFNPTSPVPFIPAADVQQLVISLLVSHYRALKLTYALYFLSIS